MDMHLNAVYLPNGQVDVAAGRTKIVELGAQGLVAAAPESGLLGYGWEVPGDETSQPWHDDRDLADAFDGVAELRFASSQYALASIERSHPELAERYGHYISLSAERWLDNLAWLVAGQDRTFESRVATRMAVEGGGTLLFAPEDLSTTDTIANLYGDVLGGVGSAFPEVAQASGVHNLERYELGLRIR